MRRAALAGPRSSRTCRSSTDHHALSANGASACFNNNNAGRAGFMNTVTGAAINANTFPKVHAENIIKINAN